MFETWERSITNVNPVGEYGNVDGIVKELDFLIGVAGKERDVEFGGDPSGGEVELGQLKGGDAEAGAVGTVENPEDGAGYGDEDEDEDDEEGGPEAAGTAAAAAVAALAECLGAVDGARGVIELGFGGWKRWVCGCSSGSGAVGSGLGSGVDSVCHRFGSV